MYEDIFLTLLQKLQREGLSLDRILKEPAFKDIPLGERVELLKKYGHIIRAGVKNDKSYWKDVALGTAGLGAAGLALATPVSRFMGYNFRKGVAAETGQEFTEPMPNLGMGAGHMFGMSTGIALAGRGLAGAGSAAHTRNLVKSYLRSDEGSTSTNDALNVIARSH